MNTWERRRSDLVHDTLKPGVILPLNLLLRQAQGRVRTTRSVGDVIASVLDAWQEFRAGLGPLLADAPAQFSPLSWFSSPPLDTLDTDDVAWMIPLLVSACPPPTPEIQQIELQAVRIDQWLHKPPPTAPDSAELAELTKIYAEVQALSAALTRLAPSDLLGRLVRHCSPDVVPDSSPRK
jgi:hypothetical protein